MEKRKVKSSENSRALLPASQPNKSTAGMTVDLLGSICDLIHEVQKERGSVALYLRSKGKEFSEELEAQFKMVDATIKSLLSLAEKDTRAAPLIKAVHSLPDKRPYVTARMIEPIDAMNFYTRELIAPAIEIAQQIAVFDPANQPGKVSALINFLHWKERVGLERALGTQLVERNLSDGAEFRNKLEYIVTEQQAYERMFLALTDEEGKRAIEHLKKHSKVFRQIDEINQNILKGAKLPSTQTITAEEWFTLFTAKMDLLHEVGKTMAANLNALPEKPGTGKAAAIIKPEPETIETSVRAYMDIIQALPLFAGIQAEALQDILKHARVVSHNKGAMIFMQREQASRFYIVLEGWVKLFKGNPEGEESILQVIGVGDTLLETVIFNNTPYPVNAQAVEQVKLLSIPAPIIRERLQHNKELAINMLATVAGRSQALISQFEQLTLKTVTQRVGWFLLKLFLENGERTMNLKLPYDKSLIANCLGMKPETFSRTLQTLREQGILVEGNAVNLPDVFALCSYCDMELAERCSRAGTVECPNPNC